MNDYFSDILNIQPDNITLLAVCMCAFLLVWSLFSERIRDIAPGLMVSAGIIGTFWGTFIALAGFHTGSDINYQEIVDQIPDVLGGMRSAFITSLIGLFFAFFSKIGFRFIKRKEKPPSSEEDLLSQIKESIAGEGDKSLSSQLQHLRTESRDNTNELKQVISGDGESSMVSQLMKLRNENEVGFKQLDGHLDGLADAIRKSLVENLQKLMDELRTAIIEQLSPQLEKTNELLREKLDEMLSRIEEALIKQFGETFKQFNEATQAIKKWQEDHRQQVEQLTEAFQMAATGINQIRTDCESIPATMDELNKLMGELDERLRAFKEMKEEAKEFFPTIKTNLNSIGKDLEESAAGFVGLKETITKIYEDSANLAKQHSDKVTEFSTNMITKADNTHTKHTQDIAEITAKTDRAVEKCVSDTEKALTDMAQKHAQAIADAMEAVAETWGKHMIAIAEESARRAKSTRQLGE